jgi:hypothetical protein
MEACRIGFLLIVMLAACGLLPSACGGKSRLDGGETMDGMPDAGDPVTCGGRTCRPNERCNAWTRLCQDIAVPYPPPGEDNGGPCMTDADCRSAGSSLLVNRPLCMTQNSADFCLSYCELPADVGVATEFVRSDCPEGSVCLPSSLQSMPDETIGTCVQECQEDDDCRTADGYYCRTSYIYPPRTFSNGYCAPAHCKSRGCAGFVCGC